MKSYWYVEYGWGLLYRVIKLVCFLVKMSDLSGFWVCMGRLEVLVLKE